MKTSNDLLAIDRRNENIAKTLSIVSLIGISTGIVIYVLSLALGFTLEGTIYDTIAVIGVGIVFMLPFVALQFFMSADIYHGTGMGWLYLPFYLILFPFVDLWFFTGINELLGILPSPYRTTDPVMARETYQTLTFLYSGLIYAVLNGAGLAYRIINNQCKRRNTPLQQA